MVAFVWFSFAVVSLAASSSPWTRAAAHAHDGDDPLHHVEALKWTHLEDTRLPFAVSDMSGTLVPSLDQVFLIGGCDAATGNERSPAANDTNFYCGSVTSRVTVLDVTTLAFANSEEWPSAPAPRYRHAAAYDGLGHIWLIGGRNLKDDLVKEVHVLDIAQKTWLEFDQGDLELPDSLAVSDNAAWSGGNGMIYVTAGYLADYNATTNTFAIDTVASLQTGQLQLSSRQGLNEARGDVHAATVLVGGGGDDTNKVKAYVAGGFTSVDFWCTPLTTTEVYDAETDQWEFADELLFGRADKAFVSLHQNVYAIGGEGSTECGGDIAHSTTPINEVEVLDTATTSSKWTLVDDIPSDRFRFTGVAVEAQDAIYAFGGQQYYNVGCDCFATSDLVTVYRLGNSSSSSNKHDDDDDADALSTGAKVGIAVGAVVGVVALLGVLLKCRTSNQSKADGGINKTPEENELEASENIVNA